MKLRSEYHNLINIFHFPGRVLFISAPMLDVLEMIEALFESKDSQKNFEGINANMQTKIIRSITQSAACSYSILYEIYNISIYN
jgi:hypothetical protein